MRPGVHGHVGEAEHLAGPVGARAPQERAQPCQQLLERERLHEVVVGARVQALHAVADADAGGQHQDRRAVAVGAEAAGHLEPVDAGHEHVEQQRVGRLGRDLVQRLAAVGRELDLVALEHERALERSADCGLVVDHEDAHVPKCAPAR